MKNNDWQRLWPHLAVFASFLIITLVFFSPLLEGKVIRQHDLLTYEGAAKEIIDYREQHDAEPLWTSRMFGGMPAYQISTYYPGNFVSYLHYNLLVPVFMHPASIVFLCMLGFYLLLLSYGVNRFISAIGGFAFAFSTYFIVIIQAGHNTKGYAIAYMTILLAGIVTAYRGKPILGAAVAGLGLALQLIANHLQITYYTVFIVLGIAITEFIIAQKARTLPVFIKTSAVLLIAAFLAVLSNITPLMLTYEYGEETIRGESELTDNAENKTSGLDKDYALAWSYGTGESMSLLVPNFKGGKNDRIGNDEDVLEGVDRNMRQIVVNMDRYFGDQPSTSGNVYVGAIIFFLFVLGLFLVQGPVKWALLVLTVFSVLLAMGKHFMPLSDFFLEVVPGYNKFRTVSTILVIAELTIPLLGFLALQKVVLNPGLIREKEKQFYIAFGLTGGLCLLMTIMPDVFNSYFQPGEMERLSAQVQEAGWAPQQVALLFESIETARRNIYTSDAFRSFIFILLAGGLLFFYSRNNLKKEYLLAGMAILVFADLFTVNRRFLNKEHYVPESTLRQDFVRTPADEQILQDTDPNFRVFNTTVSTFNDATTSYHHKSIGGYHGAKLRRYQELIERQISNNNMQVLNMLNTKYFIVGLENGQVVAQQNPGALGHAWYVDSLRWVPSADAEIMALSDFDPATTAIIDERFRGTIEGPVTSGNQQITLTEYFPNQIKYKSAGSDPGFVVFSEIYYNSGKGWQAYIDGEPAEHVRVNYVLRGMHIPAGDHDIEFRFEPQGYYTGEKLAMAGSTLLLAFVVFAIVRRLTLMRRKGVDSIEDDSTR